MRRAIVFGGGRLLLRAILRHKSTAEPTTPWCLFHKQRLTSSDGQIPDYDSNSYAIHASFFTERIENVRRPQQSSCGYLFIVVCVFRKFVQPINRDSGFLGGIAYCSVSDSAYSYTFPRSVVCLSSVTFMQPA